MHSEFYFEQDLERHMLAHGGYHKGNPKDYDPDTALFPKDIISFVQTTQPKLWERLHKLDPKNAEKTLIDSLVAELDSKGALHVLREGFKCVGKTLKLAYFAPNSQLNQTSQQQYAQNRLTIIRQVKTKHHEVPDVILAINGLPVVTIELKNELSATNWTVQNAIHQYRYERNPQELLYQFKKRTLVHFAVDTVEVYMTTKLDGKNTYFLPFNQGHNNGGGNPPCDGELRTSYLWQDILTRDSLMEIVARYIHLSVEEKKIRTEQGVRTITKETMIFPRYHQLDAVRRLIAHSQAHGSGHNYLIQHSAGSGKSNTIAWLAHQLSSLHDANNQKIFSSIIVITDRVVLDRQLQDTIYQFEHKLGVVQKIDKDTQQLTLALAGGVQIIITTIQKFPFITSAIKTQAKKGNQINLNTQDRRFAVIVDEAHSSQSGETAMELRKVLNADGIESVIAQQFLDGEDDDTGLSDSATQNLWREQLKRAKQPNLSFFAFTATPKWKTLAFFDEAGVNGEAPFHLYSMKQAIEEKFILDVLKHYTTYEHYFKLLHKSQDDKELVRNKTKHQLLRFVELHSHVIAQKVEIIIEHFRASTRHKIGGRAKAMVVTSSREHAIRYKLAFDQYLKDKGYTDIRSLVAFSGKLALKEAPSKEYSEVMLNNGIKETELPDKFDTDDYQVLLVADKYQTGFDQPLLHTMFVDKRLSGIQAVQTLSRLNRCAHGKEDTFVLDFVNQPEDIYKAFKPFYEVTTLGDIPDHTKLNSLGYTLDEWKIYSETEVNQWCEIWFSHRLKPTGAEHKKLNSLLDIAVERYKTYDEENQRLFKSQLNSFLNLYLFVSQVIAYQDSEHEKRYTYLRNLIKKLPTTVDAHLIDISDDVELQFFRLEKISQGSIDLNQGEATALKGSTDVGTGQTDSTAPVSTLVDELNEVFGTDFTIADQLFFDQIKETALRSEKIIQAAKANSRENFAAFFERMLEDLFIERMDGNEAIFNRVMNDDEFRKVAAANLLNVIYETATV
jgi:type I restriction enzyme R subunit